MCYPKPAPRCSPHAKQALRKAVAGGDPARIETAVRDWQTTPQGIRELRARRQHDLAERRQSERWQLLRQYKESHWETELTSDAQRVLAYESENKQVLESLARKGDPALLRALLVNKHLDTRVIMSVVRRVERDEGLRDSIGEETRQRLKELTAEAMQNEEHDSD